MRTWIPCLIAVLLMCACRSGKDDPDSTDSGKPTTVPVTISHQQAPQAPSHPSKKPEPKPRPAPEPEPEPAKLPKELQAMRAPKPKMHNLERRPLHQQGDPAAIDATRRSAETFATNVNISGGQACAGRKPPVDGWGQEFRVTCTGKVTGYTLHSAGPDGVFGTLDDSTYMSRATPNLIYERH